MRVIITGTSGFLGSIMLPIFNEYEIITLGRNNTSILCDLSSQIPQLPTANIVVHTAGKAHSVPKTAAQRKEFFDVNVIGTQNLLKGLEQAPFLPKSFVFISSVAVYGLDTGSKSKNLIH